jgi:hypothetical protein
MSMLQLLQDNAPKSIEIIEELCRSFGGVDFKLYRSTDKIQFITCFVAVFPTATSCIENWNDINSAIALVSQDVLHGDAAPWNLYLLISVPEPLPRETKYRIENDRFSSRKIIMTQSDSTGHSTDPYQITLENVILGRDLELTKLVAFDSEEGYGSSMSQATNVASTTRNVVRDFMALRQGLIPQDRKPVSSQLRQKYLNEMISLNLQS